MASKTVIRPIELRPFSLYLIGYFHDILCEQVNECNYSTSHALIHLLNGISSAIDQRETTGGIAFGSKLTNYETTRFPEESAGKRSHLKDVSLC